MDKKYDALANIYATLTVGQVKTINIFQIYYHDETFPFRRWFQILEIIQKTLPFLG